MRNLRPKNMSSQTGRLHENIFSTDELDRNETYRYQNISWWEKHLNNKMAIIGVDNSPHRDGGICEAILNALMNSPELPPYIDVIDCSRGGLLNAILSQGYQYAWILDTADMGLSLGKWLCFKPTRGGKHAGDPQSYMTLRFADVAEVLALGDSLDMDIPHIEIYCIQPLPLEGAEGISAPVEKIILEICGSILDNLKRRLIEHGEDLSR